MTKHLICFATLLCAIGLFSCHHDDDEPIQQKNETESDTTESEKGKEIIPSKVKYGEFVLCNQYGEGSKKRYFDAKEMDVKVNGADMFDFVFEYYERPSKSSSIDSTDFTRSTMPKYFLAGMTAVDLHHWFQRTRTTSFYDLPDNFNAAKFDTIQLSESLVDIISKSKIHRNPVDKTSDSYFSDGFGWDEGTLIGFKSDEGKCGIIKIISTPYKYERDKIGYLEIAVKYEGD